MGNQRYPLLGDKLALTDLISRHETYRTASAEVGCTITALYKACVRLKVDISKHKRGEKSAYNKGTLITRQCHYPGCTKLITTQPSRLRIKGCCRAHGRLRLVENEYPIGWPRISKETTARFNYTCQECGYSQKTDTNVKKRLMHTHHRNMNTMDSDPDNLVALCATCHSVGHRTGKYEKHNTHGLRTASGRLRGARSKGRPHSNRSLDDAQYTRDLMERHSGDVESAANEAKVSINTLYRSLDRLGIHDDFRVRAAWGTYIGHRRTTTRINFTTLATKDSVLSCLQQHGMNIKAAAEATGIAYDTFHEACSRYGLLTIVVKSKRGPEKGSIGHSSGKYDTKFVDMTGRAFGRWTVIKRAEGRKWLCKCDCGTERDVDGATLRNGKSTQCHTCGSIAMHERRRAKGEATNA